MRSIETEISAVSELWDFRGYLHISRAFGIISEGFFGASVITSTD
jgi:hypothetical protein